MSNTAGEWEAATTRSIGRAVRDLRGSRTVQWLSDATDAAGKRIAKASISELENGNRKSVSVTDVIILALALNVPPMQLLFPRIPDGKAEVTPGRVVDSWFAAQWFSGASSEAKHVDQDVDLGVIPWARERSRIKSHLAIIERTLRIREELDAGGRERLLDDIEISQQNLERTEAQIVSLGGVIENG